MATFKVIYINPNDFLKCSTKGHHILKKFFLFRQSTTFKLMKYTIVLIFCYSLCIPSCILYFYKNTLCCCIIFFSISYFEAIASGLFRRNWESGVLIKKAKMCENARRDYLASAGVGGNRASFYILYTVCDKNTDHSKF